MPRLAFVALSILPLAACGTDAPVEDPAGTTSTTDPTSSSGPGSSTSSGESGTTTEPEVGTTTEPEVGTTTSGESTDDESTASSTTSSSTGVETDTEAAQANDDLFATPMDETLVVDAVSGLFANDVDPEGGTLMLVNADAASERGGTVTVEDDGSFTYEPPAGAWGPDSFAYTVDDGTGASASAVATVNITPVAIPLPDVAGGEGGIVIDGGVDDFLTGFALSRAGDVDGDGHNDVVVSTPYVGPESQGAAFVVFGADDLADVDLDDVSDGLGGFRIDGRPWEHAAWSVSGGGDVDGDGLDDLVLGGEWYTGGGPTPTSWVVFGKADGLAIDLADVASGSGGGFVLVGEPTGFESENHSVSVAGDVNGDGLADVVVGIRIAEVTSRSRSYVIFGKADAEPVALGDIVDGIGGFVLEGESGEDNFGFTGWPARWVSDGGDINGDGLDDVIIGDRTVSPNGTRSGRSYVVFGKADTQAIDLADVAAGEGGFAIDGENIYDGAGSAVNAAGDVNGDGLADVIIGAAAAEPIADNSGRCYVVFGKMDTDLVSLASIAAGDGGFAMTGETQAQVGRGVVGGGDVNGDGLDDVMLGAVTGYGRAYVVYGTTSSAAIDLADVATGVGGFVIDAAFDDSFSGEAVALTDIDGDLLSDLLLGAPQADATHQYAGRSYLVWGTSTAPYAE